MSSSTLHRPAIHSSWWYIAAGIVLAAAVLVVLTTAIKQGASSGSPRTPAVVGITHYSPVTRACFAGRPHLGSADLDRSLCAPASR
jgi:hypothetical protein